MAWLDLEPVTGGIHHAKYLVADGRDTYIGSANLDWRALERIVELGVRIEDPGFGGELAALFDHDWHVATAPLGVEAPSAPARRIHALAMAAARGGGEAGVRPVTRPPRLGVVPARTTSRTWSRSSTGRRRSCAPRPHPAAGRA